MTAKAAFFDIDRTLVAANTGNLYMRWRFRQGHASLREVLRVMRWMAQYTLGTSNPSALTTKALSLVEGESEAEFIEECERWFADDVVPRINQEARQEVLKRQREGYRCAILSAATPYIAGCVAREFGIEDTICSKLEVKDGLFTGRLVGELCYGQNKVTRSEAWAESRGIRLEESAFYSDSFSDTPMLERVGEPIAINPDPRLRWHAKRRGWPIRIWDAQRLPKGRRKHQAQAVTVGAGTDSGR